MRWSWWPPRCACTPPSRVHAESGKRLWIRPSGMAGCRPCRTAPAPVSPPSPRTSSTSTPCSRPTTTGTPIRASPPSGWRSAPRGTAARRCPPRSTTTTSRPPARPSSSTGPAQGTDGPAVHRPRHPRAVRARLGHRVRGVPGQRRARARGLRRRLHPHPRRLDGDHRRQPRPHRRPRRRRRHHARATTRRSDGGFKYNPPHGGPADTDATAGSPTGPTSCWPPSSTGCKRRSLDRGALGTVRLPRRVRRRPARTWSTSTRSASAGVRIGADPLGGASVAYWGAIAERHKIDLTVVNPIVDPQFAFMTLDWDGKIRMDCSSPYAMASLVARARRLPDLDGQRRRRRPARHRHRRRRADEPQPLPRRRDRLPLREPARTGPPTRGSARRPSARR